MRQTRQGQVWLVVFLLVFWMYIDAGQAAPELDVSFGQNGFVVKDFGGGQAEIFAVAPQSDGKLVVAGEYNNGAVKNLAVARYLPTGVLDPDFNDDGIFTYSLGSGDTIGRSVAIQGDGKILVAGSATGAENGMFLLRLTAEGFPDSSFADSGQRVLPVADGAGDAYALRLTGDGAVLMAGTVVRANKGGTYGLVAKVTATGGWDTSFGQEGVALVEQDGDVEIRSLALQEDGKIVAAGSFAAGGTNQAGLLRLTQNGSIDTRFGENGQSLLALAGGGSIMHDIALDASGRLYVVGVQNGSSYHETFLARFGQDGKLDDSFGDAGLYRSTLTADNEGQAMRLDGSGNLYVAGFATTDKGKDVFLLTLKADSTSEASAGSSGTTSASTPSANVASTKAIFTHAISQDSTGTAATRAVFTTSTSASANAAANSGISVDFLTADLANTTDIGNALAVMPDGSVFVAGATGSEDNQDFALLRFSQKATKAAASSSDSADSGVSTAGYTIQTRPVTNITRVGAMSGGIITDYGTAQCADACNASCSTGTDSTTCLTTCLATCTPATVSQRGVVFGIASKPSFQQTTTSSSSTNGSTSSSSTSNSSSSSTTSNAANILQATTTTGTTTTGTTTTSTTVNTFPANDNTFVYTVVETGQTSDGSGTGSYGSIIHDITPNTVYFVRAYALLSDGTVIYGNEQVFRTDDACFIATAAYGSLLDSHVAILREFRDQMLLPCSLGQRLICTYYHISPRIADLIVKYEVLRPIVRVILIPFVFMAYFILKTGLVVKLCLLTAFIGFWPLKSRIFN